MKKYAYTLALTLLTPIVVLAAETFDAGQLQDTVESLVELVNVLLVVLAGVAVIVFIVGIIQFVLRAGDAEKRKEARGYMIYGVIAFAVIIGLYGLANGILSFFNVDDDNSTLTVPKVENASNRAEESIIRQNQPDEEIPIGSTDIPILDFAGSVGA